MTISTYVLLKSTHFWCSVPFSTYYSSDHNIYVTHNPVDNLLIPSHYFRHTKPYIHPTQHDTLFQSYETLFTSYWTRHTISVTQNPIYILRPTERVTLFQSQKTLSTSNCTRHIVSDTQKALWAFSQQNTKLTRAIVFDACFKVYTNNFFKIIKDHFSF